MSRISFTKTAVTTLSFIGQPGYPKSSVAENGDKADRTAGNVTYAYDTGIDSNLITLTWDAKRPLRAKDYSGGFNPSTRVQTGGTQSLLNWYWNVAAGALNTFTYNDKDGIAWTVRWEGGPPKLEQLPNQHYVGTIVLRVEYT